VTKDVPAYSIVGGNPARVHQTPVHGERRWQACRARVGGEWDHETLRRALPDFRMLDIEGFLEKYEAEAISARATPQTSRPPHRERYV